MSVSPGAWSCGRSLIHNREWSRRAPLGVAVLALAIVLLTARGALRAEGPQDKAEAALKALSARFDDPKADREQLRLDLLAFEAAYPGAPSALRAAQMVMHLPSPLDRLDPKAILARNAFPDQPKELVAVLGARRLGGDRVWAVAFSPDRARVVVSTNNHGSPSTGDVRLWDAQRMQPSFVLKGATIEGAFSPDGKTLATDGPDGTVQLWDLSGSEPKVRDVLPGHTRGVTAVAYSPDGKTLAAASAWPTVRLWDLSGPKPTVRDVIEEVADVLAFSPDGKTLAACQWWGTPVRLWDLSGPEPKPRAELADNASSLIWSPDGRTLAAVVGGGVRLWDLSGAEPKQGVTLRGPGHFAAFSPDGKTLVKSRGDDGVSLWDLAGAAPRERAVLKGHPDGASNAAFSPDGKSLLTVGARDGAIRLWDPSLADPIEKVDLPGHVGAIHAAAFSPDGRTLATGGGDGTLRLWDLSAAAPKATSVLEGHTGSVICAVFSPDGKTLASSDNQGTTRLWDLSGAAPKGRAVLKASPGDVKTATFSPDGKTLATDAFNGIGRLWDLSGAAPRTPVVLNNGHAAIVSMAFSPDGRTLATGGEDGAVLLWDLSAAPKMTAMLKGAKQYTHPLDKFFVDNVAFTPDGKTLVSSEYAVTLIDVDSTLAIWDLSGPEAKARRKPVDERKRITLLAAGPDAKAACTDDTGRVAVYDLAAGSRQFQWALPGGASCFAFAPDGRHLVVGGGDGAVYVLRLAEPPKAAS